MDKIFVAYYRVSTKKQNGDMKAQRTAVKKYLKDSYPPAKSFTEVESGAKNGRPELSKALDYCKANKAILVVAKLDRLSRDLGFIAKLQDNIDFVCCDMPEATRETIGFMAVIARWEREQIGKRTKEALAEKRKEGVLLGSHNPKVMAGLEKWRAKQAVKYKELKQKAVLKKKKVKKAVKKSARQVADNLVLDTIKALKSRGLSYKEIAKTLNHIKITSRWGKKWHASSVFAVAKRNNL